MTRRQFFAASAVAAASSIEPGAAEGGGGREYYELRRYLFGSADGDQSVAAGQRALFDKFMREAAIPALNRLGLKPIGVFFPAAGGAGQEVGYVVIPHPTMESVASLAERLGADSVFTSAGEEYLDATREQPAYKRIESSVLHAFSGLPKLETPVRGAGRVVQLRIYESPSEKTNLKKIEMFNEAGEIAIFRKVGLRPVFFGRAVAGDRMPNLTYMLAFESEAELKANWDRFRTDPDWQKLRAMPEYADKTILSGITNLVLKPAEYSQI